MLYIYNMNNLLVDTKGYIYYEYKIKNRRNRKK